MEDNTTAVEDVSLTGDTDAGLDANTDADAAWSSTMSRAVSPTSEGESEPEREVEVEQEQPEPELIDDPEQTEGAEQPEASADEDDPNDIQPDSVKGKQLFFREQKAKRLMAAAETMNRISEQIPDATPESINGYYQTAVASEEMDADFHSGDPARIAKFADFWLGPQSNPAAVQSFAAEFVQRLPHIAPEVAKQVRSENTQSLVRSLYEEGMRSNDENLFAIAQHLDVKFRGRYFEKGDFKQRDPFAEQRARFEQERTQFDQRVQADAQRRKQERVQSIDSDVATTRSQVIEEALKPVAETFQGKPQWKHMMRDLTETVETAINNNAAWKRQFDLARERAINDPSGKSQENLKAMLKQFVAPIVSRNRKTVIEAATGTIMQASKQAHADGRQTAARREPTAAGSPVQRSTHDARMREAIKNHDADAAWAAVGQRMVQRIRR